ncbi:hypothetical protein Nmel_006025, partial [Mimus melanotis]
MLSSGEAVTDISLPALPPSFHGTCGLCGSLWLRGQEWAMVVLQRDQTIGSSPEHCAGELLGVIKSRITTLKFTGIKLAVLNRTLSSCCPEGNHWPLLRGTNAKCELIYLVQMWNIFLCSKAVLFINFVLWIIKIVLKQGLGEIMSSAVLE